MRISPFLFGILLFASCGKSSAIHQQLAGSDSLVIQFNEPQTNIIAKTLTSTEDKAIRKLIRFVDGKTAEAHTCGYDGNLMFYRKGELKGDVSFNYSGDSCRHFILSVNGKLTPTVLANEAADFLKSLNEGRGWY